MPMQWNAEPDEAVVIRCAADFAEGVDLPVAHQRSFRDTARRDIEPELAGWPAGPGFRLRTGDEQKSERRKRGWLGVADFVGGVVEELLGGPSYDPGPAIPDPPQEPENEVEDFPVMWADPGTWARTMPWHLDPARRPEGYAVQLVLTERRLVLLGGTKGDENADLLHTVPREHLIRGEQMLHSEHKADLRLTFSDGSWVRLTTHARTDTLRIVDYFAGRLQPVRASQIPPAQMAGIEESLRESARAFKIAPERIYAPAYRALGQEYVHAEFPYPSKLFGFLDSFPIRVGPDGRKGSPPG